MGAYDPASTTLVEEVIETIPANTTYSQFLTLTGETDRVPNELVPGDNKPTGIDKTAVELYREFRADPKPFLAAEAPA